jgi:hypothetical protein
MKTTRLALALGGAVLAIAGCAHLGSEGGKQADTRYLTLEHQGLPPNPHQAEHGYRDIHWSLKESGKPGFGIHVKSNEWVEWHNPNPKERNFAIAEKRLGLLCDLVEQQFEIGAQIAKHGLVPILEPEVLIKSPDKPKAEAILKDALARHLDVLPSDRQVMLKLTIPDVPDLYKDLIVHQRVIRVVALSGGYGRADACQRLARNHGMIASFSRALLEELRASMSDATFNAALAQAIDEIYTASTVKV